MPADTSPLQRWILESQQELLRRPAALQAAKTSEQTEAVSLLRK
jgi:hypothetical protein